MKRLFTALAILTLTLAVDADSQQAGKQIVVTGVVKSYCRQEDGLYRFRIQLHIRNVSVSPLIIPKADAIASSYLVRYELGSLTVTSQAKLDWEYTGKRTDPNVLPSQPTSAFKVLKISETLGLDLELRTTLEGVQESVSGSFQVAAINWPGYSEQYSTKLEQAWQKHGRVWRRSLESQPIAFVVSRNKKGPFCE